MDMDHVDEDGNPTTSASVNGTTEGEETPNVLITPLKDSLLSELGEFIESLPDCQSWDVAGPTSLVAPDLGPERQPPFTRGFGQAENYPVTKEDLEAIQKCIGEATSFVEYMVMTIKDTKASLNRRAARHRLREAGGDMAGFMKSRGLGSPLVECIGIEEAWPPGLGWGVSSPTPRRKMVSGGSSSPATPPAVGLDP